LTEPVRDITGEFIIGELEERDMVDLIPIFRKWVRKDGRVIEAEVHGIVEMLRHDLQCKQEKIYLVARNPAGAAIGVMGCGDVHPRMACYQSAPDIRASGLVAAFMSPDHRGKGLGQSLLSALFDRAGQTGWTEMIWSSNPRYRETAWRFYTGIAGDPVGMIEGFFESGSKSPVWRKPLLNAIK
jgi:L-amino acid N-acyltransferase YncA